MTKKVIMDTKVSRRQMAIMEQRDFETLLVHLFEKDGWEVSRDRPSSHGDLRLVKDGIEYVVEAKLAREGRRPLLQAFLADAVLQAQAVARRHQPAIRPLAVVAAPALSEGMTTALRDYVSAVAPGMAFGLVDGRGRFEFHGEGLEGLTSEPSRKPRRTKGLRSHAADLFSDLNQLMLKVLLGRYLPNKLLHVQRGHVDGAAQLSRLAGTSLPTAWRFLSSLKEAGFLEEADAGLEVVRRDDLLAAWLSAVRRPPQELRATFAIPVRDPIPVLEPRVKAIHVAGQRIAWGSFAAVAHLGFQFVHGAPLHLYVEDLGEGTLSSLNLVRAEPNEASPVILRKPRSPQSVFRAAVQPDGQPTADILQCWLDVSQHPARGAEQANLLWTRVLAPALGIDSHRIANRSG
jgi:hypothetical protein